MVKQELSRNKHQHRSVPIRTAQWNLASNFFLGECLLSQLPEDFMLDALDRAMLSAAEA